MNYPYKNPAVRDLAWACFSPPLLHSALLEDETASVRNCGLTLTAPRKRWLQALDSNPVPLLEHIAGIHSHRLGIYFEGLWHFFLNQDESIDLLAHNLPVRENGVTLGEFDCLYYCHQRLGHFHLELAVKFFLGNRGSTESSNTSQWQEWWGPGCQDRLDLKVRHLLDHQSQLANHPAARNSLSNLGITDVGREVEVKGYLYQSRNDPMAAPRGYNPGKPMEQWVHLDDIPLHCEKSGWPAFVILPKRQWLAPAQGLDTDSAFTPAGLQEALKSHFEENNRPLLVAALNQSGDQQSRFFAVNNDWPQAFQAR
ncbi:MAG: DUF1853 family protein [Halioglobus sp.]